MAVRNPNSTDYVHPDEPNLVNLHKAMAYNTAGEPIVRTTPSASWGINISQGLIDGASFVHKFGATPEMSNNSSGSIWDINDTYYPWGAWVTAGPLTINTTAANGQASTADDGIIVEIQGLDENYELVSEQITISGSTGTGTQTFKRVFRAFITDGTLGEQNDTNINIVRGTTVVARITLGKGQTLMAVYTVPAGYTAYITQGTATCQYGADATGDMFVRYFGQVKFRVGHSFEFSGAGGQYNYNFTFPIPVPEKSDIDIRATVRSNNARLTAAWDMVLIENPTV